MRMTSLLAAGVLAVGLSAAAQADPPAHAKNKKDGRDGEAALQVAHEGFERRLRDGAEIFVFGDRQRGLVRDYYRTPANCPRGLAKKNNGCLPPGQAKKRYQVGHVLPPEIGYDPLPELLGGRLPPPPQGYLYGEVDGDVLLIQAATRLVADAIGF